MQDLIEYIKQLKAPEIVELYADGSFYKLVKEDQLLSLTTVYYGIVSEELKDTEIKYKVEPLPVFSGPNVKNGSVYVIINKPGKKINFYKIIDYIPPRMYILIFHDDPDVNIESLLKDINKHFSVLDIHNNIILGRRI